MQSIVSVTATTSVSLDVCCNSSKVPCRLKPGKSIAEWDAKHFPPYPRNTVTLSLSVQEAIQSSRARIVTSNVLTERRSNFFCYFCLSQDWSEWTDFLNTSDSSITHLPVDSCWASCLKTFLVSLRTDTNPAVLQFSFNICHISHFNEMLSPRPRRAYDINIFNSDFFFRVCAIGRCVFWHANMEDSSPAYQMPSVVKDLQIGVSIKDIRLSFCDAAQWAASQYLVQCGRLAILGSKRGLGQRLTNVHSTPWLWK